MGKSFAKICIFLLSVGLMFIAIPNQVRAESSATPSSTPSSLSNEWSSMLSTLPTAKNSENKLQPNTTYLLRLIEQTWPHYANGEAIYGWREDPFPDHPSGQALDIMVPDGGKTPVGEAEGTQIAEFLLTNADALGITYLIWRQRIRYPGQDWRNMEDRGGWTVNHMDHIHVLVDGQHMPNGKITPPNGVALTAQPGVELAKIKEEARAKRAAAEAKVAQAQTKVTNLKTECGALNSKATEAGGQTVAARNEVNHNAREAYMFGVDLQSSSSTVDLLSADLNTALSSSLVLDRLLNKKNTDLKVANDVVIATAQAQGGCKQKLQDAVVEQEVALKNLETVPTVS